MHLLIDNSNTRTKFALAQEGQLLPWRTTIATADISAETLSEALKDQTYHTATICSVVPHTAELIHNFLNSLEIPTHRISWESQLPINITYPKPETIGADRIANAVAAHLAHQGKAPTIAIDLGTAITFDVVSQSGDYLGGVIAPGYGAFRDYLPNKTALLPQIDDTPPKEAIARSTEEAMQIGTSLGFRGLVREIISGLCQEIPEKPHIITTGGDAHRISDDIKEVNAHDPDLTLKGICFLAQKNHSSKD